MCRGNGLCRTAHGGPALQMQATAFAAQVSAPSTDDGLLAAPCELSASFRKRWRRLRYSFEVAILALCLLPLSLLALVRHAPAVSPPRAIAAHITGAYIYDGVFRE